MGKRAGEIESGPETMTEMEYEKYTATGAKEPVLGCGLS
jgi:hypothetical protein